MLVYYYRDRVQLGLVGRPAGNGMVRVRGVHPDYLERLPKFTPEELSGQKTGGSRKSAPA